jgi:hypothetical protein
MIKRKPRNARAAQKMTILRKQLEIDPTRAYSTRHQKETMPASLSTVESLPGLHLRCPPCLKEIDVIPF